MPSQRQYDIVLFGATGFTGSLTAEYLARNALGSVRWALAGRNLEKLAKVREQLAQINPGCARLDLLKADVNNPDSIRAAERSDELYPIEKDLISAPYNLHQHERDYIQAAEKDKAKDAHENQLN